MSRTDYLTIGIVAVCLFALIFLIYKFANLNQDQPAPVLPDQSTFQEETYPQDSLFDTYEDSTFNYDPPATEDPKPSVDLKKETVAPVEPPREKETDISGLSNEGGDYLVLAGSFRQKANAESEVRRLKKLGYEEAELALFNRGAYASVLVGRFETYSGAASLVAGLRKDGVEAYIQKKRTGQR